jgi:hypothetical protein
MRECKIVIENQREQKHRIMASYALVKNETGNPKDIICEMKILSAGNHFSNRLGWLDCSFIEKVPGC